MEKQRKVLDGLRQLVPIYPYEEGLTRIHAWCLCIFAKDRMFSAKAFDSLPDLDDAIEELCALAPPHLDNDEFRQRFAITLRTLTIVLIDIPGLFRRPKPELLADVSDLLHRPEMESVIPSYFKRELLESAHRCAKDQEEAHPDSPAQWKEVRRLLDELEALAERSP